MRKVCIATLRGCERFAKWMENSSPVSISGW